MHHRNATAKLLGHFLEPKFKDNSRIYKGKDIQHDIYMELNIDISYKQAWRSKNVALESLAGCPGETGPSWTWFLSKLKECIGEILDLTIISDRHATIKSACEAVFPNAFHGYCCRHLMMNCKLKSIKLQCLFWKMCKAYSIDDFNMAINELGAKTLDVYEKLFEDGVERWSRAYCPNDRYNYMTSNSAESINRVIGLTNCNHLAKGWFRRTTLKATYQGLAYLVGEVSSWQSPNYLQVVKPPLMDKRPSGRPKSINHIISQGEEPV
ncbi:transposase, MuDR, MULE transposase domain protein [Tanacetum coccineum]